MLSKWKNRLAKFHRDEDGIEAIQVVMILAFAAVVLVAAWAMWDKISSWASSILDKLLGKS